MSHDPELERRITDLQANQQLRRLEVFGQMEISELRAIKKLAFDLFGDRGMLEADAEAPGLIKLGYFLGPAPKGKPGVQRPRRIILRGFSHAELEAQARLWRSRR